MSRLYSLRHSLPKNKALFFWLLAGLILATSTLPAWAFLFPREKTVILKKLSNQKEFTTTASTVADFLEEQTINLDSQTRVSPSLKEQLADESVIEIFPAHAITIQDGNQPPRKLTTTHQTVKEALLEAKIELGNLDQIEPNLDHFVEDNLGITITRFEQKELSEEIEVSFETITQDDPELAWGETKTIQVGKVGQEQITYQVTLRNGEEVDREEIKREILKEPQKEIIARGTKIKIGRTQEGLASWYAWTGTLACASTTFPKGTRLRVTSLENDQQVTVVVNDYGPQPHTGKIIDLDKVAFEKLAPAWKGVVRVKIEEIL